MSTRLTTTKQNQYNSVEYPLDISNWQQQQQQRQHQHHAQYQQQHHMPYPVVSTNTNSAPPSQGHFWMSPSTLDSSFVWENNLPTDPFIVPKVEDSVLANSNLALNSAAIQGAWNNEVGFSSRSAWTSSCIGGLPTQGSANISSSDMAVLPSQDSVYSDNMDHKTYALGPVLSTDHASPAAEWSMVGSVFSPVTEGTSPESMASVPMLVPTRTISSSGLSTNSSEGSAEGGLMRTAALTESPDMYRQQSSAAFIFDGTPSCGSTYPYSHHTSPDTTQWYPPGYSPSHPGLPQPLTNAQIVSHKQTTRIEGGRYDLTKQSQAQWSGFVTEVPECDQQGEPPVMQNADSDTKRKTDDEILMKCKAEGITYKEIKKRLRTKVAESTLRGRYRALTKPRKDRVRKPVWTEKDVSFRSSPSNMSLTQS
jgi:hypothetical protein